MVVLGRGNEDFLTLIVVEHQPLALLLNFSLQHNGKTKHLSSLQKKNELCSEKEEIQWRKSGTVQMVTTAR